MEPTACLRHKIGNVVFPDMLDMMWHPSSFAQDTRSITSLSDCDTWDVKLLSSNVNQKFFGFAGVQAHVVVCCPLLNVIHSILKRVLAMRVAHFVQSDVIDELHVVYVCVQVVDHVQKVLWAR